MDAREGAAVGGELAALRARLRAAARPDERVSPLRAPGDEAWPAALRAGVIEPRRGYRFRPENASLPALLSRLYPRGGPRRVVDLGAGSGSLLLCACALLRPVRAVGIELQGAVAERLARSLAAHGLPAGVVAGDLREAAVLERAREALGGSADLCLANPPFFPPGWGRPSALDETHRSTHALAGGVAEFLAAARSLLAPGGRVLLLYDAGRLAEALAAAGSLGFRLARLSLLPDADGAPFRAWVELGDEGAALSAGATGSSPRAGRGSPGGSPPPGRSC